MIDLTYNDKVIIKRFNNAFFRDEKDNACLIISKGCTINNALVINEQGEKVLELVNNKRTLLEIINELSDIYPEVPYDQLKQDVYVFMHNMIGNNLLRVKGMDEMYNGHVLDKFEGYEIFKCSEGDYKIIYQILNDIDKIVDFIDSNTPENLYDSVNLRAKIFTFYEEFYILKKEDEVYGLISIVDGKSYINKTSIIGKMIALKEYDSSVFAKFLDKCMLDYRETVVKDCKKIRVNLADSKDERSENIKNILKESSFKEIAKLEDELGENIDVRIYNYLF